MNDLPPGWEWATLGDVAETSLGKMLDKGRSSNQNLVPYLRNANVQWGQFDLSDVLTMDIRPELRGAYEVKAGDLLVCEGGEIGRCAIWPGSEAYIAYQKALHRVRLLDGVDSRYLRYLLEHLSINNELLPYSTGSTIKHLPQQQLRRLLLPLAPTAEQRRIVAALEDHLSRLKAGKRSICQALARARALKKSIIADAFGRNGLGARREIVRRLADVVQIASGQTPRGLSELPSSSDTQDAIPFYKVGDMNLGDGRYVSVSRLNFSREILRLAGVHVRPAGTVLLPKRGGAIATNKKRILLRDAAYDLNTMGLIPSDLLDSKYLWYWMQGIDLAKIADGSNIPQINNPDLASLLIPVPSLGHQAGLAAWLDDQFSAIDHIDFRTLEKQCEAVRRSLLTEAFAGRLVPQDPDDEPTSVLLERIRTERATQQKSKGIRRTRQRHITQEVQL